MFLDIPRVALQLFWPLLGPWQRFDSILPSLQASLQCVLPKQQLPKIHKLYFTGENTRINDIIVQEF